MSFSEAWNTISGINQNGHRIGISRQEFWRRFPKAVARKVTAEGVNHFGVNLEEDRVLFISGYTHDRGLFCDELDAEGRVIPKAKVDTKSFRFGGSERAADWDALDYAEGRCLGDVSD